MSFRRGGGVLNCRKRHDDAAEGNPGGFDDESRFPLVDGAKVLQPMGAHRSEQDDVRNVGAGCPPAAKERPGVVNDVGGDNVVDWGVQVCVERADALPA